MSVDKQQIPTESIPIEAIAVDFPIVAEAVPVPSAPSSYLSLVNDGAIREYVARYEWPQGLQEALITGLKSFPVRYFICDDSGSMMADDGSRLIKTGKSYSFVNCTRWAELADALKFHVGLAQTARTPSEFRLLNSGTPVTVGSDDSRPATLLLEQLRQSPGGGTPLCRHIREVISKIKLIEADLRANRQKACIIIATDGESTDGDIAAEMRPLQQLPVWVVIRLCTNEDSVVEYWNNIDSQLELDMDVLDDLRGEAEEVKNKNPWLTYAEPLHRLREFGIPIKELDLLDESKVNPEQLRAIASNILGESVDAYPHPQIDFDGFVHKINVMQNNIPKVFDPLSKEMDYWIKPSKLAEALNKKSCVIQ